MFTIGNLEGPFGYRRDGEGRVVYLFNGEVDVSITELVTDQVYTEETDDGEIDLSTYYPSMLDTDSIGEIEGEISLSELLLKIDENTVAPNSLFAFFESEIYMRDIPLIFIDLENKSINQIDRVQLKEILNDYVKINFLIQEYDHIDDY